jgi:hypothetical protein
MSEVEGEVCSRLDARLAAAQAAVATDSGASAVLAAVLAEFGRKFRKTRPSIEGDEPTARREGVIELEQAADSTKWAALADAGASDATKLAVVAAHDTICWFKATGRVLDRDHIEADPLAPTA